MQSGRYGLCSTVLDNGKYRQANETEVIQCCLETSKDTAKQCLDECKNLSEYDYANCRTNCARIILAAENTCALSNPKIWRGNSPIIDCVTNFGCGTYPDYDVDCIRKNKDALIRCCNKDCIPSSTVSCTDHCTMKYYDMAEETKDPLLQIYNQFPEIKASKPPKENNSSIVWYILGVDIALIIGVIILYIVQRKREK